jgi:hypothetical protein
MLSSGMSEKLSGAEDSVSRAESGGDGKMPIANANNCMKLCDSRPSATENRTFLTLAIPVNLARLSTCSSAVTGQFIAASRRTTAQRKKRGIPKLRGKNGFIAVERDENLSSFGAPGHALALPSNSKGF